MPLQGSLGPLGLAEVLQTGLAGRSSGNLVLRRGVDRAVLHISDEGIYLYEPEILDAEAIVDAYVDTGRVPKTEIQRLSGDKPDPIALLDRLIEAGTIPQQEIVDLLANAVEDLIVDLITWKQGDFRFDEGASAPAAATLSSRVCIDTGTLLLRAAQRADEREAVHAGLGQHAILFVAADPSTWPPEDDTARSAILRMLDGRAVIDEISLHVGLGRFSALKLVFDLVQTGAARVATPDEVAAAVDARVSKEQWRLARALLLQWIEVEPHEVAPYERLAAIAAKRDNPAEEADALTQLGRVLLDSGKPHEAATVFRKAVDKRDHDGEALAALREAARASRDDDTYRSTTIELARQALHADDAERAAALLCELSPADVNTLDVRLLRTRALLRLKDRVAVVAEVESIRGLLGNRCRRKQERDAASFCRDAIAHCAPERSDLLRHFRALSEGNRVRSRRLALVGALLAIVAAGGYLLWPQGPTQVLEQAQAAVSQGDVATAEALLQRITEEWPDSPEAEVASQIQAGFRQPKTKTTPAGPVDADTKKQVEGRLPAWQASLRKLPALEAREALDAACEALESVEGAGMRSQVLRALAGPLADGVRALVVDARIRTDNLGRLRSLAASGGRARIEALRVAVEEANTNMSDGLPESLIATRDVLTRVARLEPEEPTLRAYVRDIESAHRALIGARRAHARDLDECRRLLATAELEADYEACREVAPKHLVAGRLDEADELYERLEQHLTALQKDTTLSSVHEAATRRQIPQFVRDRRGVITEIRAGLAAASAAEAAGDLTTAIESYATLAKRFWMVRFENVFQLPLLVETVPAGARIAINGRDAGASPVQIRYGWGSQTTLTIESPGFEPATELLRTADEVPKGKTTIRLTPKVKWTEKIDSGVVTRPVAVGNDVLVVDRSGRATLHAHRDGHVLWTRQVKSLEGIRHRGVSVGSVLALPFVDGNLHFLSPRDGTVLEIVDVGRPTGDAAAIDDRLAVPTAARLLVGFVGRQPSFRAQLSGDVTAGALAAHGAFWVGNASGDVERVDPSGRVQRIALESARSPVIGLAAHAEGIIATTGDGQLFALGVDGSIRWHTAGLGDVVGLPAAAGRLAACADRRGRIVFFDLATGQPRGQVLTEAEPTGGLLAWKDFFLATLQDGRLFVYDAVAGRAAVDVPFSGAAATYPLAFLSEDRVAVPAKECCVSVISLEPLVTSNPPPQR